MSDTVTETQTGSILAEDMQPGYRYWDVRPGSEDAFTVESVRVTTTSYTVFRDGREFHPEVVYVTYRDGKTRRFEKGETVAIMGPYRAEAQTTLQLTVRWVHKDEQVLEVTGTRHAYYLLRKLAARWGFHSASLDVSVPLMRNVIRLDQDDITGSDRLGKFRHLLDRDNLHYDLARKPLK